MRTVSTTPFADQKPGTSGLRKKVKVFQQEHYLENFVQSIFDACPAKEVQGSTFVVSGDGRFHNKHAIQRICEIAAGNGVARVVIGQYGLMSTPAVSCVIREKNLYGGILLTASHNPGGPENDFGVKFNTANGGPAPESITDKIFDLTKKITEYRLVDLPTIDLESLGEQKLTDGFTVELVDPVESWVALMKTIFDFDAIRRLLAREDFSVVYDGMHGVAGPYAKALFLEEFKCKPDTCLNCEAKEDFGGGHPDPNLTYAKELVDIMKPLSPGDVTDSTPAFGAAGDGDCDRNMILGKGFFVTPSDSVAIIAAHAKEAIPYFSKGLAGVARSMPTSCALDRVAEKLGVPCFETPTGWKFFGNLMDAGKMSLCGEESFGTGSDHVREKDGIWAVLAWLSILAFANRDENQKELVTVEKVVKDFWSTYGRCYYSRYDYEEVDSAQAKQVIDRLNTLMTSDLSRLGDEVTCDHLKTFLANNPVVTADNFTYHDPVDGSVSANQGVRFIFGDGSRMIWRLSGTGSVGATVRVYFEKYVQGTGDIDSTPSEALKEVIEIALALCRIKELTGRDAPTVIT